LIIRKPDLPHVTAAGPEFSLATLCPSRQCDGLFFAAP
jgi:hypothetical protein